MTDPAPNPQLRRIDDPRFPGPVVSRLPIPLRLRFRTTTVFLVRHADKGGSGADPPLSSAGHARVDQLSHMLEDLSLAAVFVTPFLRSVDTGTPPALAHGLTPITYQAGDTAALADTIKASYRGRIVLVVAHSNTIAPIASGLGAVGATDLDEDQYDRMYVVHRAFCTTHLDVLNFGARP